jgi:uncharacterized protein YegP (UPF0339 family)
VSDCRKEVWSEKEDMIRQISALAAVVALSLSSVACMAPSQDENEATVEGTSDEIVSRSARFETFEGVDGRTYFHLVAANGENVLRSQGYTTPASAAKGIRAVLENGADASRFEVLEARNGERFFHLKAANGEVIGTSELYASRSSAERGARTVRALVKIANGTTAAAPRSERFELFTGEDGKAYFHLRAGNGEILLASQGYGARSSARAGISATLENGSDVERFEIFEAADAGWGVRLVARNGEIVARGETYASRSNATRAVNRMVEILSRGVAVAE